jgi:hypothetical protein
MAARGSRGVDNLFREGQWATSGGQWAANDPSTAHQRPHASLSRTTGRWPVTCLTPPPPHSPGARMHGVKDFPTCSLIPPLARFLDATALIFQSR